MGGNTYAVVLMLAAAVATVLAPREIHAGGCPPTSYAPVSYSYPATVSYSAVSYAQPVKTVYKTEKVLVPYAVPAAVKPDYYSSSESFYQQKLLVDAVAGKTAEALQLQQRLQQMEQALQQQTLMQSQYQQWQLQQMQQQAAPPQQQHQPGPWMPPANGYGYGHPPAGQQWQPQQQHPDVPPGLQHLLQQRCNSCHGDMAARRGGGLDLRQPWNVDYETRLACHSECSEGNMPKSAQRLAPEELSLLYQWAQMGRQAARR